MQVGKLNPQFTQSLYDSYTKCLLHFDGPDGAVVSNDTTGKTVTFVGNAQIDTAQSKFGGSSLLLDGTGDAVYLADSADWDYGTGNFTVDFWLRPSSLADGTYLYAHLKAAGGESQDTFVFYADGSGYFRWVDAAATQTARYNFPAGVIVANEWHHYELVRNGTTMLLFKDGVSVSWTEATAIGSSACPNGDGIYAIGNAYYNSSWIGTGYAGHIDEFRISKGIARHTSNFTPPTRAYDNTKGKLNFPGFQEILDFTSAGSESSVSVAVDGDTDKEYKIVFRNLTSVTCYMRLNGDTGASAYGYQQLQNDNGTITASRGTTSVMSFFNALSNNIYTLLTPTGFVKTGFAERNLYTSGTTMRGVVGIGHSYNSTSNITAISFFTDSGNFTAGTRITVYARRSNV